MAQMWLIYRLTDSGFILGLTATLTLLPSLLFGIYGGWLADRYSRRNMLIIAHTLAMLQAFTLGILTIGGWIAPWHILLLAFALGIVLAIETPVRQAFIFQLVSRDNLPNAIALSSSMFHVARFVGPAIAGVLVTWISEGPVFIINGFTFIAVLVSLLALQLPQTTEAPEQNAGLSGIWSGLHYAWHHKLIRTTLAMVATVSLFGSSAVILMPIFIVNVFDRGPDSLGLLMGMLGSGSLIGALMLANKQDYQQLEHRVAIAGVAVGIGLCVFAVNELFGFALGLLVVMGLASTTVYATSNALIQLTVPDYLRGRIMALFAVSLHGMVSIGQLAAGSIADLISAPATAGLSGIALFIVALYLAIKLFQIKTKFSGL